MSRIGGRILACLTRPALLLLLLLLLLAPLLLWWLGV
jgi:hypothetical protein